MDDKLTPKEVDSLLSTLCVELGFCLPSDDIARLCEDPPDDIDRFVSAVYSAEGLDPTYAEKDLWRQVRQVVAAAFERHAQT